MDCTMELDYASFLQNGSFIAYAWSLFCEMD